MVGFAACYVRNHHRRLSIRVVKHNVFHYVGVLDFAVYADCAERFAVFYNKIKQVFVFVRVRCRAKIQAVYSRSDKHRAVFAVIPVVFVCFRLCIAFVAVGKNFYVVIPNCALQSVLRFEHDFAVFYGVVIVGIIPAAGLFCYAFIEFCILVGYAVEGERHLRVFPPRPSAEQVAYSRTVDKVVAVQFLVFAEHDNDFLGL